MKLLKVRTYYQSFFGHKKAQKVHKRDVLFVRFGGPVEEFFTRYI